MSEYWSIIAGSSTTNVLFLVLFGVLNHLRKRLNKSKCQSHCYIFDCEAQLDDLQHVKTQVNTQRGMLQNVLNILDAQSQHIPSSNEKTSTSEVIESPDLEKGGANLV